MGSDPQTEYRNAVHAALERFQFVEEILRVYLDLVIQVAKLELKPYFPVNLTKKDLSKMSLGRLTDAFSRFNSNATLRADLKKITPERNRVAHQSLLFTLGELEDVAHMSKRTAEIKDIAERAKHIHEALLGERWELQGALTRLKATRRRAQQPLARDK